MNPVAMTIINPQKEYWPSWGSNQKPLVLKSTTLPTELLGSAHCFSGQSLSGKQASAFKKKNIAKSTGVKEFQHDRGHKPHSQSIIIFLNEVKLSIAKYLTSHK